MAEALAATATLVSIIGFSAQVFDGCVKGFVLLSSAHSLGRDAEILRSMLDWEQFRLEQWAERVGLRDPAKADMLVDWKLAVDTLKHIDNLLNDTTMLKKKYNLVLAEEPIEDEKSLVSDGDQKEKASTSRFKRLFGQSDKYSSTAAAKVIQAKNSPLRRLWWASVDKDNMKRLIDDISQFVHRLNDSLNTAVQAQMQNSIEVLLTNATDRYSNVPDLEFLRELATRARIDSPDTEKAGADEIDAKIDKKFANLLFRSIREGDLEQVEALLDRVDVHVNDNVGWPPLVRAAEGGQLAIVNLLLQRGADPLQGTIGKRIPLHFAAEGGHVEVVELLLRQPAMDPNYRDYTGQTALFKAANTGHSAVVKHMLLYKETDADAFSDDGFSPLTVAIFGKYEGIVRLLLARPEVDPNACDKSYNQTPLWMAAPCEDTMIEDLLARQDIDVDRKSRYGETALGRAARQYYHSAAQLLLDAKADCNVANDEGATPLSSAAGKGNEAGMELLLKRPGIELNTASQKGETALHRAAEAGHTKCVKLLLEKGAKVEISDKHGKTALSVAAAKGHKVIAKVLLKHGANINKQDSKGNTPLALAAENNHDAVVRFLLESGADAEIGDEDEETPFEKARDKHLDQIVQVFKDVLKI